MRAEDDIVKRPHPTLSGKPDRTLSYRSQHSEMVAEIAGQKRSRADQGGQHEGDVQPGLIVPDSPPGCNQQDSADPVQSGVDRR